MREIAENMERDEVERLWQGGARRKLDMQLRKWRDIYKVGRFRIETR